MGADLDFFKLQKEYNGFANPRIIVEVEDKSVDKAPNLGIGNVNIELTCEFQASIATFNIYNSYLSDKNAFDMENIKAYVSLGSVVVIKLGYDALMTVVFKGFIAKVDFHYDHDDIPGVEVTCLDVKGAMMSGSYSKQLSAKYYCDAVSDILSDSKYSSIVSSPNVINTPDKPMVPTPETGDSDKVIEMVNESDYEFVVKIAKRYNYEFYTVGESAYFRKAKSDQTIMMVISTATGLKSFNVTYDITGLVGNIEVRGMDAGTGKMVNAKQKMGDKISGSGKAKAIVSSKKLVYLDSTVTTKDEATERLKFLASDSSYRLGTIELEIVGIPVVVPGRYIELKAVGEEVSNKYYITSVTHIMDSEKGYYTRLKGKTSSVELELSAGGLPGI